MTTRIVQNMMLEYCCDECKRTDRRETHPEHWVSVNVDAFAAVGGNLRSRLDLCGECAHLEKYKWAWQR